MQGLRTGLTKAPKLDLMKPSGYEINYDHMKLQTLLRIIMNLVLAHFCDYYKVEILLYQVMLIL